MILHIDNTVYSREAILETVYRFSGDFTISVKHLDVSNMYEITFSSSDVSEEKSATISNAFIRELNDQQVRLDIEKRFGHIRDLIVEEAFKPVMKR